MVWTLICFLVSRFLVRASSLVFLPVLASRLLSMVSGARWLNFWLVKLLDYTYIIFIGFEQLYFRTSFLDKLFRLYTIIIIFIITAGSKTLLGSEAESFLILVNDFLSFDLVIRNSTLDLTRLLDLPLFNITIL